MRWRVGEAYVEPEGGRPVIRLGAYGLRFGRRDEPVPPVIRVSVVDLEDDIAGLDPDQQRAREESRAAQDELMRWVASLDDDQGQGYTVDDLAAMDKQGSGAPVGLDEVAAAPPDSLSGNDRE